MSDTTYAAAVAYAADRGRSDGLAAASWYELPDGSHALRRIIDGIESGDPIVLDTFPSPDLSGQWADSLTGPALVCEALQAADAPHDGMPYGHAPGACATCDAWDATGDICDAYETAYSDAVESDIGRRARYQLGD